MERSGSYVTREWVKSHKVRAFTLEPLDPAGMLGLDGEQVPFEPLQFRSIPGLINILQWQ